MQVTRGDELKLHKKSGIYTAVRTFVTASGVEGWWVMAPGGWYTVCKESDIKKNLGPKEVNDGTE